VVLQQPLEIPLVHTLRLVTTSVRSARPGWSPDLGEITGSGGNDPSFPRSASSSDEDGDDRREVDMADAAEY
jgi:hypothetical protein